MSDTRVDVSGDPKENGRLGRRTVLRGVAVGGVGITALAACGSDDESESGDGGSYGGGSSEPSETSGENGGNGGGGGTELGATSEVPVGGGVVYGDEEVVVTQPTAGEFVGFSAVCKHAGCILAEVSDGSINCGCHGSRYDMETGEPVEGPNGTDASTISALDPAEVTVQGQKVMLA